MKTVYKRVDSITEFIDAIRIRVEVFIKEQKCRSGWEPDEEDKLSDHYIAIVNNEIVATTRVREINNHEFKIERMAIKKEFRNKGIGRGLVMYILKQINKLKPRRIWIQAQLQAREFYEKCGFKAISKPYNLYDLGIPHVDMEHKLR